MNTHKPKHSPQFIVQDNFGVDVSGYSVSGYKVNCSCGWALGFWCYHVEDALDDYDNHMWKLSVETGIKYQSVWKEYS